MVSKYVSRKSVVTTLTDNRLYIMGTPATKKVKIYPDLLFFYRKKLLPYAGWIASVGHTSAHVPQSVQISGSIT